MKKRFLLIGMAVFTALAMAAFIGCQMETGFPGESVQNSRAAASRQVSVPVSLVGTTWLGSTTGGVSVLDFTDATNGTGTFSLTPYAFTYEYYGDGTGTITDNLGKYGFTIDANNTLVFDTSWPYNPSSGPAEFRLYEVVSGGIDLESLVGTTWLGVGPRGESVLDVTTSTTLVGTFGPDSPNTFGYTYEYSAGTGKGTMDGAGEFTTADATDTMFFDDFWGHGVGVTFNLITFP